MTPVHYAPTSGPRWLTLLLMWSGGLMFMVTFGSTLLGIIARYFGWVGLEWTFETAEISFIWVTFLGAVLAEIRGENVRFSSLVTLCSAEVQRWLRLFSALVLLGLSGWLLSSGLKIVQTSGWVPTPVLRLPNAVITCSLVGFALMLLFLSLWRIWHFFFSREGDAL